jgi:predicted small integral membrane protein
MREHRIAKVVLVACLALYALLVAVDNLLDYQGNYTFVQHVMSMDTVFPDNPTKVRAVTGDVWHTAIYVLIIAAEAVTGLLYAIGAIQLGRNLRRPAAAFARGKRWVVWATVLGFAIWFFAFMVIAGEYFDSWQSKWNAQDAAFRIYVTMLAVLIYVGLPEPADDDAAV